MGFWDKFEKPERVKGDYLKAGDLVGETLLVVEVREQPNNVFQGEASPRFLIRVVREDGSEGLVPFSMGFDSRDDTLKAIAQFLETDESEPVAIVISRVGRFLDINPSK